MVFLWGQETLCKEILYSLSLIHIYFCSVHCTWAFAKEGYETIIVNNNPETVSTDFDIADKLYFEPLTPEDVESIVDLEKPDGAVVQFGGQTAIKLTESLMKMGVPILGTSAEDVDAAEDRELFDEILAPVSYTHLYIQERSLQQLLRSGILLLWKPVQKNGLHAGLPQLHNIQKSPDVMRIVRYIHQ